MTVKSVAETRQQILNAIRDQFPDWVMVEGEVPFDVIDFVADFHYDREFVRELVDSFKDFRGFRRLLDDTLYRQQVAAILNLSLTRRSADIVYKGVPAEITNDVDAFIYYWMDRIAEAYGRVRRRGSSASGTVVLTYTGGLTGSCSCIFNVGNLAYTATFVLDGSGTATGIAYSFGYGARYNVPRNSLKLKTVIGSITAGDISAIANEVMAGGTDFQSNESFLTDLETSVSLFSGPLSRNAMAQVIGNEPSVDKYLIRGAVAGERFLGSSNIYIKGGVLETWTASKVVDTLNQVLVPYQPSTLVSVRKGGVLVPATEYMVVPPLVGDASLHSIHQMTYIDFTGSVVVSPGDTVELELLVNTTIQAVYRNLQDHFSQYYESVRDLRVYEAQPQLLEVRASLILFRPQDKPTLDSTMRDAISGTLAQLAIDATLDADDLRSGMRAASIGGQMVVDAVETLEISDDGGVKWTTGRLTLNGGRFWTLNTSTFTVL